MSLFRKIIKTKLVAGFLIPSSIVKFNYKILIFLKPILTALSIKNFESHLQCKCKMFIQSLWLQIIQMKFSSFAAYIEFIRKIGSAIDQ